MATCFDLSCDVFRAKKLKVKPSLFIIPIYEINLFLSISIGLTTTEDESKRVAVV